MSKTVDLSLTEVRIAMDIGMARWFENFDVPDKPYYDRSKMLSDRLAQPAAVACEIAVAKVLGVHAPPSLWQRGKHERNKHEADVGPIEVRLVRKPFRRPWFRTKDRGRWLIGCHADPFGDLTQVDLLGAFLVTDKAVNYLKTQHHVDGMEVPETHFQPIDDELLFTLREIARNSLEPARNAG